MVVICPRMRDFTEPEEIIDGIQVYRHWISEEAGAISGFFREYCSALWGEFRSLWKAWRSRFCGAIAIRGKDVPCLCGRWSASSSRL